MAKLTLSTCILDSLKCREMIPEFADALLAKNRSEIIHHDETELWDYKETVDFENPLDVANIAKDILGFHNMKGGALIIGVTNSYKVSGLNESQILDTNQLVGKLYRYIGMSVPIFQGKILVPQNKFIWVIFISRREDAPIPISSNGPAKNGKLVIKSGDYYMRVLDQTKLCIDANDYRILFSGYSTDQLMGYSYDLDIPFFRLLSPHCDRFIGRLQVIQNVHNLLVNTRFPIIALDGVGGVGKSAVAIELVKVLYDAKSFDFIVSLSAKNKVWDSHIKTRRAGFSGMAEMLREIAKVVSLDFQKEPDELKIEIAKFFEDYKGLLLLDNIEEIQDQGIFDYLEDVFGRPDVKSKVLVTSRTDRSLGAKAVSIPEMSDNEARELLYYELRKAGYTDFLDESFYLDEILSVTGKLPLALKWAASLAGDNRSLKSVSQLLRSANYGNKKEFLNFCYATMYDALSPLSKEVALLGAYLGEEWNAVSVSLALDKPISDIEDSIQDIKNKGLLLAAGIRKERGLNVLPLTLDFLASKWAENSRLRERVNNNFIELLASNENEGLMFQWPNDKKVSILRSRAIEFAEKKDYEKGLRLIKLAAQYSSDNHLLFLQGKISYQSGRIQDGLSQMRIAREKLGEQALDLSYDDIFFLGKAISGHGLASEEKEALKMLFKAMPHIKTVTKQEFAEFIYRAIQMQDFGLIKDLINAMLKEPRLIYVVEGLWNYLEDENFINHLGPDACAALEQLAEEDYGITFSKKELLVKLSKVEVLMNPRKVK